MRNVRTSQIKPICATGASGPDIQGSSGKGLEAEPAPVPVFVRKAVQLGYSCEAVAALYGRIAQTRADIRARRITPAGGIRRVERLALAVDVAQTVLTPTSVNPTALANAILDAAEGHP